MMSRHIGPDLTVHPIGLGCMGMSFAYGGQSERDAIATVHRALDIGVNHFDTAELYGPFENEELLGKALAGRRHGVVVATKFGYSYSDTGRGFERVRGLDSRPENVRAVAEASLRRLGTDVIDLFYQHRVDPAVPIEETVGAMGDLVRTGKVRAIGLSEASAATIRRAHAVHPVAAVQSEYSIWSREPENDVLALCRELGIAFVAYSPLGRGLLTTEIGSPDALSETDFRRTLPRFQPDNMKANRAVLAMLGELAAARGVTVSQLALAWVLHRGEHVVTIPGSRKIRHLEENVAACSIELTAEETGAISDAASPEKIAGTRYAAEDLALVGR